MNRIPIGWTILVLVNSGASFRWLETPFLKLKDSWRPQGAARFVQPPLP